MIMAFACRSPEQMYWRFDVPSIHPTSPPSSISFPLVDARQRLPSST